MPSPRTSVAAATTSPTAMVVPAGVFPAVAKAQQEVFRAMFEARGQADSDGKAAALSQSILAYTFGGGKGPRPAGPQIFRDAMLGEDQTLQEAAEKLERQRLRAEAMKRVGRVVDRWDGPESAGTVDASEMDDEEDVDAIKASIRRCLDAGEVRERHKGQIETLLRELHEVMLNGESEPRASYEVSTDGQPTDVDVLLNERRQDGKKLARRLGDIFESTRESVVAASRRRSGAGMITVMAAAPAASEAKAERQAEAPATANVDDARGAAETRMLAAELGGLEDAADMLGVEARIAKREVGALAKQLRLAEASTEKDDVAASLRAEVSALHTKVEDSEGKLAVAEKKAALDKKTLSNVKKRAEVAEAACDEFEQKIKALETSKGEVDKETAELREQLAQAAAAAGGVSTTDLEEREAAMAAREAVLAKREVTLAEREVAIAEREVAMAERDAGDEGEEDEPAEPSSRQPETSAADPVEGVLMRVGLPASGLPASAVTGLAGGQRAPLKKRHVKGRGKTRAQPYKQGVPPVDVAEGLWGNASGADPQPPPTGTGDEALAAAPVAGEGAAGLEGEEGGGMAIGVREVAEAEAGADVDEVTDEINAAAAAAAAADAAAAAAARAEDAGKAAVSFARHCYSDDLDSAPVRRVAPSGTGSAVSAARQGAAAVDESSNLMDSLASGKLSVEDTSYMPARMQHIHTCMPTYR